MLNFKNDFLKIYCDESVGCHSPFLFFAFAPVQSYGRHNPRIGYHRRPPQLKDIEKFIQRKLNFANLINFELKHIDETDMMI